jgi:uroporphyrinogen-III synthase
MSMPLWLVDPVNRVPDLVELFRKADACPWIFPRLHHVYQWHLALCGKQETLREVEAVDPEFAIGLAAQTRSAC